MISPPIAEPILESEVIETDDNTLEEDPHETLLALG
jgi:hypothetical protein